MNHAYQSFNVLLPESVSRVEDFHFDFKFENMQDVIKGKVFSGKNAVGPIRKVQQSEKIIMFVQMEHRKGSELKF